MRLAALRRPVCLVVLALAAASALAADAADPAQLVEALKGKDTAARLEAARRAKDVQDEKLVSPLAALLTDDDAMLREAVVDALAHRTAPEDQKKAATALGVHLARVAKRPGADLEVITAAQALGELAQPASVGVLMAGIELDTPPDVVDARLMAVAQLPTPEAVDELITFLAKQGRGRNGPQREACRSALREATGQNFGNEADLWRSWWKDAKKTFDFAAAASRRAEERRKKDDAAKRRKEQQEKRDKKEKGDGGEGGGAK